MASSIVRINSTGDDDPHLSGSFEVARYSVKDGTYGDEPIDEPQSFSTYDEAEAYAKNLAAQYHCKWERSWS